MWGDMGRYGEIIHLELIEARVHLEEVLGDAVDARPHPLAHDVPLRVCGP